MAQGYTNSSAILKHQQIRGFPAILVPKAALLLVFEQLALQELFRKLFVFAEFEKFLLPVLYEFIRRLFCKILERIGNCFL